MLMSILVHLRWCCFNTAEVTTAGEDPGATAASYGATAAAPE